MSFWPLPTNLAESLLAAARRGPLVELGSGGGGFARRLRAMGVDPLCIDLRPPAIGDRHRFVTADLRQLPLAAGSAEGLVLANTLRHLNRSEWPDVAAEVYAATRPGGIAVVLEDDPVARSRAEENYRDAWRLLAAMTPDRGTVATREECLRSWRPRWGDAVSEGDAQNEETVNDPLAPVLWLQSRTPRGPRAREVADLAASVRRWGMEYGRFWFCVFSKGPASV